MSKQGVSMKLSERIRAWIGVPGIPGRIPATEWADAARDLEHEIAGLRNERDAAVSELAAWQAAQSVVVPTCFNCGAPCYFCLLYKNVLSERDRYRATLEAIGAGGCHGASFIARGALYPEKRGGGLVTPTANKPPAE